MSRLKRFKRGIIKGYKSVDRKIQKGLDFASTNKFDRQYAQPGAAVIGLTRAGVPVARALMMGAGATEGLALAPIVGAGAAAYGAYRVFKATRPLQKQFRKSSRKIMRNIF